MEYSPRFRLFPTTDQRDVLDWTRDTVQQLYNHGLKRFNENPDDAGTVRQRVWRVRDELPDVKNWWANLTKIYSTVLQVAIERIRTNINNLGPEQVQLELVVTMFLVELDGRPDERRLPSVIGSASDSTTDDQARQEMTFSPSESRGSKNVPKG